MARWNPPAPHVIHPDQVASNIYEAIRDLTVERGDLPVYAYDPDHERYYNVVTVEMDPAGHSIVVRLGGASA